MSWCRPPPKKKTKSDKEGLWVSENDNLGQICYLIQYFIDFIVVIYVIGGQRIHF